MSIFLRNLFLLLLAFSSTTLAAQDAPADASSVLAPAQALTQLRSQLDEIKAGADASAKTSDLSQDAALNDMHSKALSLQQLSEQLTATLAPQMTTLQARIDVLGPAPAKGISEPVALTHQRKQLSKDKTDLDTQIKQAASLTNEAGQLATHVAEMRRDQFQAQLSSRTASPFSSAFWVDPAKAFPDDAEHFSQFCASVADAVAQAWQPPNRVPMLLCLLLAVLLFSIGRQLIERAIVHICTKRMPAGRLRRSTLAVSLTLAYALTIGLGAHFVYLALNWNSILSDDLDEFLQHIVRLVAFAAFMAGVGRALLSNHRPSWRLSTLSDEAALKLRQFPFLLGTATLLLGTSERINDAIDASLPATVTTRSLLAILIALIIGTAMLRLNRARLSLLANGKTPPPRPVWAGLLTSAIYTSVALVFISVILGYIAFGFFLARQMLWTGMIFAAAYLLIHLVDDVLDSVFDPKGRTGQRLQNSFGLSANKLEQAGTLFSGIGRTVLVIFAITFVAAPFGAGPQELFSRVAHVLGGTTLGKLSIVPSDILSALLVFTLGVVLVRIFKGWLGTQFLPTTALDIGMQSSLITLVGYVGGVLVFVLALAALKVDLQGIAWMASALSVGIGFGLQAIVQNFISGLIMLVERPVKVGDWVNIAGVEGDVRRINVRATEIQMSDHSTMIVPNSQFITQNVRNMTLANAQGRVNIQLPMPLDTDAEKARQIILDVFTAHASTLDTPAPTVQLDSVDAVSMNFNAKAYVRNPRDAGKVKSDLLFEILQHLRDAQLPLSKPQDMVIRTLSSPNDAASTETSS